MCTQRGGRVQGQLEVEMGIGIKIVDSFYG